MYAPINTSTGGLRRGNERVLAGPEVAGIQGNVGATQGKLVMRMAVPCADGISECGSSSYRLAPCIFAA
jgi:hypothetical protein